MNLKTLRHSLSMKQEVAADICGITQSDFSKAENFKNGRHDEVLGKLQRGTGIGMLKLSLEKQGI
jgi:transcriptional regulator with XRE-family HTH domain